MPTPGMMSYGPDQVSLIFGPVPVDGFASGEMVRVEPDVPMFTRYVGADGKVIRVRSMNRCTRITVRLQQGSAANDAFSAAMNADLLPAGNGAGVVPLSLFDRSGRTVIQTAYAWLAEWPQTSYGAEASEREWVIETAETAMFVGGN